MNSQNIFTSSRRTQKTMSAVMLSISLYMPLKKLEQFKVNCYEGDPAKFKEKIDARCHTGCKSCVLAFLKHVRHVYEDGIMYKVGLAKMDEVHLCRVSHNHLDLQQLQPAYKLYYDWFSK